MFLYSSDEDHEDSHEPLTAPISRAAPERAEEVKPASQGKVHPSGEEWVEDLCPNTNSTSCPAHAVRVKRVEADNGFKATEENFEAALDQQYQSHPRYRAWLRKKDFISKALGKETLESISKNSFARIPLADVSVGEGEDKVSCPPAMQPVLDSDGHVIAVESPCGYCLSVDERDMLDMDALTTVETAVPETSEGEDESGSEEDEELEEKRMDDLVTVAVAQRLVECFEDKENFSLLEAELQEASVPFLSHVVPLLRRREELISLQNGEEMIEVPQSRSLEPPSTTQLAGLHSTTSHATQDTSTHTTSPPILPSNSMTEKVEALFEEPISIGGEDTGNSPSIPKDEPAAVTDSADPLADESSSCSAAHSIQHRVPWDLETWLAQPLDRDDVFAKAVDLPLKRILRVYKNISRPPRPENVVIDGKVMDF